MIVIRDTVTINTASSKVWKAIQNTRTHAQWHPFVTHITGEHTLGSMRTCDVEVGGKPGKTSETCTLFDEARAILWSIDEDTNGFSKMVTNWTAGFRLNSEGEKTIVTAESHFTIKNLFLRLMLPLIKIKFHGVQKQILDGLKQYVENH